MGLFERFAHVESPSLEVTLLPELGTEPAFIVTARMVPQREVSEAVERYSERGNMNMKKYRLWWARRYVIDWSGCTINNLHRLIPAAKFDEDKVRQLFGDGVIPYSVEMAADLHLNALTTFANPINEACTEKGEQMTDEVEDALRRAQGNLRAG